MKKITFILVLLTCLNICGQNRVARQVENLIAGNPFTSLSVLNAADDFSDKNYQTVVDGATTATLNFATIAQIFNNRYANIEIAIPYQSEIITVQLYQADIYAEGFHVDTDKAERLNYNRGVHYRGIIKGDSGSLASFSFFNDEMTGIVSSPEFGNIVIARLNKTNNRQDYIVYSDQKLKISPDFKCHVDADAHEGAEADRGGNETQGTASAKCVSMYLEVDHNIYQGNGSSVFNTTNWISAVFNNVQTLYANDGITVALKAIFIWTTPDPYTGDDSQDYRDQFASVRPVFDGDVGQLIGIDPGGLGGIAATIGGICTSFKHSYSDVDFDFQTVPTFSWTVQVITHEFGHLLGSRHTHSCVWNGNNTAIDNCGPVNGGNGSEGFSCMTTPPTIPSTTTKGTIMSYCHLISGVGISFTNGFGPQPAQAILNHVNFSSCLSANCLGACVNNVHSINVTQLTSSSVQVTWSDSNTTTDWEVAVAPVDSEFPFSEQVPDPQYTAIGLTSGATYKAMVRPVCAQGLTTTYAQFIFVNDELGVTDNVFTGLVFYPNPANDFVQISANESINEILVYNIEGRLLYSGLPNANNARIDIAAFASGTYFFKLKGEGKVSNFKILKL